MANEENEMAGMEMPKPGTFCWTEIASSDADKCMAFYTDVFGWEFQTGDPSNTGMDYREYTTPGGTYPAGGLYELTSEMCPPGQPLPPPHFMTYIAVDDVDENAKLATELGGTIIHGPMDVPNVGRMCVIKDPAGATFSTFRAKI